tara:strand:+ start:1141 stop:1389 length:249 start_codon:yes stop_codon:yes gene_type:complete
MPRKKKTDNVVRPFICTKDPLVRDLLARMSKRSDEGLTKYKVSMDLAMKPIGKWIEDAQEEEWDKIVYLEKVKRILEEYGIK